MGTVPIERLWLNLDPLDEVVVHGWGHPNAIIADATSQSGLTAPQTQRSYRMRSSGSPRYSSSALTCFTMAGGPQT